MGATGNTRVLQSWDQRLAASRHETPRKANSFAAAHAFKATNHMRRASCSRPWNLQGLKYGLPGWSYSQMSAVKPPQASSPLCEPRASSSHAACAFLVPRCAENKNHNLGSDQIEATMIVQMRSRRSLESAVVQNLKTGSVSASTPNQEQIKS